MGEIEYRVVEDAGILWELMDVMKDAWGMSDYTEAVPPHMMWAVAKNGGFVMVALEEGRVVGFVLGFTGRDERHGLYHYSHMVGVRHSHRGRGIALRLKLEQRKWALGRGYSLIVWTYDPHQGLNARFNFAKLGVINREFYPEYYGVMKDSLNRGLPSDRFRVEWWIGSKRVRERISGRDKPPTYDDVKDIAKEVVVTAVKDGYRIVEKVVLDSSSDIILVEFPGDINALKESDLGEALRWKMELRKVFTYYLRRGYIVIEHITLIDGVSRRNFYLLWRAALDPILEGEYPWR